MKKIVSFAMALSALGVFAAAEPQVCCLSFSTPGPDTYADGTPVARGECYALVWSKDGVFEGIQANGKTVDPADRVVYVAPTETAGKCSGKDVLISDTVMFGSVKALDGQFGIYLLDTRKFDGTTFTVGKANPVNYAQQAVASFTATLSVGNVAQSVMGVGIAAGAATPLPPGEPTKPTIVGFEVGDETVTLTVANTSAWANYGVQAGVTPKDLSVSGTPKVGGGTITLIVPKQGDSGFFQVNRK